MKNEIAAPEMQPDMAPITSPSEKLVLKAKEIEKAKDAERMIELEGARNRYNEWIRELHDLDPVNNPDKSIELGIKAGSKADNAMDIFQLGMEVSTGGFGASTLVDFASEQAMETAAMSAVKSRQQEREAPEEPSFKQEIDPFAPPSVRNRHRGN